jgi:hypothetical protein
MSEIKRASASQMRQALEMSDTFRRAGVWFVPMPVLNEKEFNEELVKMMSKISTLVEITNGGCLKDCNEHE